MKSVFREDGRPRNGGRGATILWWGGATVIAASILLNYKSETRGSGSNSPSTTTSTAQAVNVHPSLRGVEKARDLPDSLPRFPLLDGPFGVKFGSILATAVGSDSSGACNVPTPTKGSLLSDLKTVESRITFVQATRSIETDQLKICEAYLGGALAFVFVPYRSVSQLSSALIEEFDHRFGKTVSHPFRTKVDYGIFSPDIQTISLIMRNWKSNDEQVELAEPQGFDVASYTYSEGYAYLLYMDARRSMELRDLKSQVVSEEAARKKAEQQRQDDRTQKAVRRF